MKFRLALISLFTLAFILFLLLTTPAGASLYPVTATDGHTTLTSDGHTVVIQPNGIVVGQAGIFSFTFMDAESALMNRVDGHVFILQLATGAVFHLGQEPTPYPTLTPCPLNRCLK
jgi:hypothetical protein